MGERSTPALPGPARCCSRSAPSASISSILIFAAACIPGRSTPLIPGAEAAGVVERVGEGVTDFKPSAIASPIRCRSGAYRTRRVVPAERLVKLPDGIDFDVAASVMLKGLTAQFLLTSCYPVKRGRHRAGACGRRRRRAAAGAVAEDFSAPPPSAPPGRRKRRRSPRPTATSTSSTTAPRISWRGSRRSPAARLRCGLRLGGQGHLARIAQVLAAARNVRALRPVVGNDRRLQILRSRLRRLAVSPPAPCCSTTSKAART